MKPKNCDDYPKFLREYEELVPLTIETQHCPEHGAHFLSA